MIENEHLICAFIDDHEQDEIFTDWPLHITLVPWFVENDMRDLQLGLTDTIKDRRSIDVTIGLEKVWGAHVVNIVQPNEDLQNLHEALLRTVKMNGQLLVNEQYTSENYTPHVTHQDELLLQPGAEVTIKYIYIIEKHTAHRKKNIVAKIELLQ